MHIESLRELALSFDDVTEGFPFGESVWVCKVKGKIFLLASLDEPVLQFNVKCEPDQAVLWREEYPDSVLPGYHMNKKHWNTVIVDGRVPRKLLEQMVRHSYDLVSGKKK